MLSPLHKRLPASPSISSRRRVIPPFPTNSTKSRGNPRKKQVLREGSKVFTNRFRLKDLLVSSNILVRTPLSLTMLRSREQSANRFKKLVIPSGTASNLKRPQRNHGLLDLIRTCERQGRSFCILSSVKTKLIPTPEIHRN